MRILTYLAKLEPSEDGGYGVSFPDVPGCFSCGDNLDDAMTMAKEALELHIYGLEQDGDPIPVQSKFDPEQFAGCVPAAISICPDMVRLEMDNRKVKTNTTIPYWLKSMAEKRGVNFSKLLEAALIEYLGVSNPPA